MTEPALAAALVLHDFGAEGGAPWRAALRAAGWPGEVEAPDLPGHGRRPAPLDGNYEYTDAAWFGVRVLHEGHFERPPVVIGVGDTGWSAHVLALGQRVGALVLVDGLGGPWQTPEEWVDAQRRWIRSVADDAEAVAPAPPGRPDPRLGHGVLPMGSRDLAERAAASLTVPVLVIQTPAATVDVADHRHHFPAGTVFECTAERRPDLIAPIIVEWASALSTRLSAGT